MSECSDRLGANNENAYRSNSSRHRKLISSNVRGQRRTINFAGQTMKGEPKTWDDGEQSERESVRAPDEFSKSLLGRYALSIEGMEDTCTEETSLCTRQ